MSNEDKRETELPQIVFTKEMLEAGIEEFVAWQESESYLIEELVKNIYRRLRVLDRAQGER